MLKKLKIKISAEKFDINNFAYKSIIKKITSLLTYSWGFSKIFRLTCHFCNFESYPCINKIANIKLQSSQYLQNIFNVVSFDYKKVQIVFLWQNGNIINVTEQNIVALKTVPLNSPAVS